MSERFLKLNLDNDEADFLASRHPNAFILLYFIAKRARRIRGLADGLNIGECHLGDWESLGFTRQNYRTALKVLIVKKFIQILETNRTRKKSTTGLTTEGTKVILLNSVIWDINSETSNHRTNHCPTTAQPLPNHRLGVEDSPPSPFPLPLSPTPLSPTPISPSTLKKEEEGRRKEIAQSAPRLRSKDSLSFDFDKGEYLGITALDMAEWAIIYPHIDLKVEITKSITWLKSNPTRNKKKLWRKFLTGWFQRTNEKLENKKAYSCALSGSVDRRTRDIEGKPFENLHKGKF